MFKSLYLKATLYEKDSKYLGICENGIAVWGASPLTPFGMLVPETDSLKPRLPDARRVRGYIYIFRCHACLKPCIMDEV